MSNLIECESCEGHGRREYYTAGPNSIIDTCDRCGGTGTVKTCVTCHAELNQDEAKVGDLCDACWVRANPDPDTVTP